MPAQIPVPPTWTLYPATLQVPWCVAFLTPDAKGDTAIFHWENQVSHMDSLVTGFCRHPTATSMQFFAADSFKMFVDSSRWLCHPIKSPDILSKAFTALHWFGLSPAMSSTQFPASGLDQEQMAQAFVNIKFMIVDALTPNSAQYMSMPYGHIPPVSILTTAIDLILGALEATGMKEEWTAPNPHYTDLVFEDFEQLHILLFKWITSYSSSLAMLAEAQTINLPPLTVLLLNPAATQQVGAPTIMVQLEEWQRMQLMRLVVIHQPNASPSGRSSSVSL